MKTFAAAAGAILVLSATAAFPEPAAAAGGPGARTLYGIYTSGFQSGPQRLRAVFTPAEDGNWNVSFHFRFSGEDRVYSGRARGSLSHGLLHGRVRGESQVRTFTFRCEFDQKKRRKGEHAEVVRTGEHETGTITLKE